MHSTELPSSDVAARPWVGVLACAVQSAAAPTWIVDPIDGTRAFIDGQDGFSHSLAIADGSRIIAAVVHLPVLDLTYTATADGPALLNGQPIAPTDRDIDGAGVLTYRGISDGQYWRSGAMPPFRREFRSSLAWRLSLAAEGRSIIVILRQAQRWR